MKVYRNKVPGNESTPVLASRLTAEERELKFKIDAQNNLVKQYEDAMYEAKAAALQLEKSCKHHAFYDEDGVPYNMRWCCVCGSYLGLI